VLAVATAISAVLLVHTNRSGRHAERLAPDSISDRRIAETDSAGDGTPDFLRLEDPADQEAFRRWFTFLAEAQYYNLPSDRPAEIVDCAALIRYSYREALRRHDSAWTATAHLPLVPAIDSVRKYSFPHTPLGPALFRVRPGAFSHQDLHDGAFSQFADADSIRRFNTFFISRDVTAAEPGDLLFFRRDVERMPYHSMIVIGPSHFLTNSNAIYVVYDTGPTSTEAGVIKRLALKELLYYPDPQWHPRATNPLFLGVFRWNILNISL
jgi:uncharacterized protein YfaT (DUF1175 family)